MSQMIRELIERRDELCFKMIECSPDEFNSLCAELNELEMNIEAAEENNEN